MNIEQMTASELAALDLGILSPEESKAVDRRLIELQEAREQARDATSRATARARAIMAEAFEAEVMPGLLEKYGELGRDLAKVRYADGYLVVKRPHQATFRRFFDAVNKRSLNSEEVEKLLRPCVVYPEKASLDALFDRLPGLAAVGANAAYMLATQHREEDEGK